MIKKNKGLQRSNRGPLLLVLMCGIMELPFVQLTASDSASCFIRMVGCVCALYQAVE